ncbi:aliphatic nitrilase [Astrocystis sublimbata]|nr:aliphatic nitrilase [Astrocystis sublimbata]
MDNPKLLRVAVTQAEPQWLDLNAAVAKMVALIEETAGGGAQLIAFPEVWITGYPTWLWGRTVDPPMVTQYTLNALSVDSAEMDRIRDAALASSIAVVFGFAERTPTDSLYISQAIISPQGELVLKRRKIKPTHVERTVFGDGSGPDLNNVVELDFGSATGKVKVGTLACWEHTQPLLKYHTYAQGEAVHISMWPPLYSHGGAEDPSHWALSAEGCLGLSQTYAVEGGKFVLHCTGVLSEKGIDKLQTKESFAFNTPGGGQSCVIGPDGRRLTAPLDGGNTTHEGIVYADLDLNMIVPTRHMIDVVGHYSRPDLLWLGVDKRAKNPVAERAAAADE